MSSNKDDEPISGPSHVGPKHWFEIDHDKQVGPALFIARRLANLVRKPADWIRENVVEPNRGPKYYWYHRKFERALPIDECYTDDLACIYEANIEYRRNFLVDRETLDLLRYRRDSCNFWNSSNKFEKGAQSEYCKDLSDTYDREELNFFIKYGDQHYLHSVSHGYNKQKHRMIMERRLAKRAEIEGEQERKAPQ